MTQPPAGWYRDPQNPQQPRWWDGQKWGPAQSSAPPGPPPVPPPAPQKGGSNKRRALMAGLAAVAVIGVIAVAVALGSSGGKKNAASSQSTSACDAACQSVLASISADPAPAPSLPQGVETVPGGTYDLSGNPVPSRADFTIKLRILSKQCFGSAGCVLTYRIDPTYTGTDDLSSGTWDVTYEVTGGDAGPITNTFTIDGGQAHFDGSEEVETASQSTVLHVKVTDVQPG